MNVIIEAMLLGFIAGKIRGGKLDGLTRFAVRMPFLLIAGFLVYVFSGIMIFLESPFFIENQLYITIGVHLILFAVLFFNLQYRSVWLILLGTLGNFTAVVLNQGKMPLDPVALENAGMHSMLTSLEAGTLHNYISVYEVEGFTTYLGKIFATPEVYPFSQVLTPGDILIAIGLFFLIQRAMLKSAGRFKNMQMNYKTGKFR